MPHEILWRGRRHWLLLVGILLLAAFLRLYQLDHIPPGFHYDEAFNAIQARDVVSGANRPIFFVDNFGEEPMQMYVEAAVFALAGESPYNARLSNVILGLLLIPALYFCGRSFFPGSRAIPLVAAFIGATIYWAINFSRLGIETGSLPWILTLSAGALVAYGRREPRQALTRAEHEEVSPTRYRDRLTCVCGGPQRTHERRHQHHRDDAYGTGHACLPRPCSDEPVSAVGAIRPLADRACTPGVDVCSGTAAVTFVT
jgi:hypothetical protein